MTASYGYALLPPDSGLTNTTWLPPLRGSAATCAGMFNATGTSYSDSNNAVYTLGCGLDVGSFGDIGIASAPDFPSCMALCDNLRGCTAFSWLPNTCYFKNLTGYGMPPINNTAVDMAWLSSKYAGYSAGAPVSLLNFNAPVPLYGATNQSAPAIASKYLGSSVIPTYDPSICASQCASLTATRKANAIAKGLVSYNACNYFSVYNITISGAFQGLSCQLFSDTKVAQSATLTNGTQNNAPFNVQMAYGYSLSQIDPGNMGTCSSYSSYTPAVLDDALQYYTLGCGYTLAGTTLSSVNSSSFAGCFGLCDATTSCSGFTYTPGLCTLKNMYGVTTSPVANSGSDSAFKASVYAGDLAFSIRTPASMGPSTITTYTGSTTATQIAYLNGTGVLLLYAPTTTATGVSMSYSFTESGTATTPLTTTVTTNPGTYTVLTVYPTPVLTCGNAGVRYAVYNTATSPMACESWKAITPYASTIYTTSKTTGTIVSTYVTSAAAVATGVTNGISFKNYGGNLNLYNVGAFPSGSALTVDHTFYLFAGRGTGNYTFAEVYSDDVTYTWAGAKAISGWTSANNDSYHDFAAGLSYGSVYSVYLTQGSYYPLRALWYNTAGNMDFSFYVFAPDGSVILKPDNGVGPIYQSSQVVTAPCDSSLVQAPWPAWGAET